MPQTAIVGYAARLPGANTLTEIWQVLKEGHCTVSTLPEDRWSSLKFLDTTGTLAGHSHTRAAGVLDDPWSFDPAAFGISPREATQMDPQQRILLELVSEAFDHAGIDPRSLERNRTGVFIGAAAADHSTIGLQDPSVIESHYMLGNTLSILANRISYQWDFHGPSMTIDTACSSGLIAFHQARQAIEAGEIDTAIVGGVSLLMSPVAFIGFSNAGMLSHIGRCAAFGATGDGYVRSEGAVVFVLTRRDLAQRSGLTLHSVVAGSGVNTAGYTRGITIPSESQQAALIRDVLTHADISADDLAFAEAHGTGTPVGDPREAAALGTTYGALRKTPLPIGSAKTNFGHLEPVSGLVGLLKAQLALDHNYLPATLFADTPNPDIDFATLNLDLMTAPRPLPQRDRPWAVSVNSFGFGGANAHVIVRQPGPKTGPAHPQTQAATTPPIPPALLLSAQSDTALRQLVALWQTDMATVDDATLAQMVAGANHRLARQAHRLCLTAGSRAVLETQIHDWLAGTHPDKDPVRAPGHDLPVAFVFSGNGALWDGMARQNYLKDPAFRSSFNQTATLVATAGGPDLVELLMSPQDDATLSVAHNAQPLHFAIQIALVASLAKAGLHPAATLGHSLGEVAASVVAGRLSLKDGINIILRRSAAFAVLENTGTMAALSGARARVAGLIEQLNLPIDISAENAPNSVTVSGTATDIAALIKLARKSRIAGKVLPVPYPYHSRAVAALETRMRADLADLSPRPAMMAFYSGCLGTEATSVPADGDYWWLNARNPVEFRAAAEALLHDGYQVILEISPRSVLKGYLGDIVSQLGAPIAVLGGLEKSHPEARCAADITRRVLAAGGKTDETTVLGPIQPIGQQPPRAPFERQVLRLHATQGPDIFGRAPAHALLGALSETDGTIWRNELALCHAPWLADHAVGGRILLPATGIAEIFLAAARDLHRAATTDADAGPLELDDLDIVHAVIIPAEGALPVRVTHDGAARQLTLETGGDGQWQKSATVRLFDASVPTDQMPALVTAPMPTNFVPVVGLYDALADAGLTYGPAFARLQYCAAGTTADTIWAKLAPRSVDTDGMPSPSEADFILDPTGFDAALHAIATLPRFQDALGTQGPMVPSRIGRLRWLAAGAPALAHLSLRSAGPESACLDIALFDDAGTCLALAEEIRLRRMPMATGTDAALWDEILVPLPGQYQLAPDQVDALIAPLVADNSTGDATATSDADVVRSAIAARFAWDLVTSPTTKADDPRLITARTWLAAADMLPDTADSPCPWPPLSDLIPTLGGLPDDVQDDLNTALSLSIGQTPAPSTLSRAQTQLRALLGALPPRSFGRVLVLGRVDTALLRAADRLGHGIIAIGGSADHQATARTLADEAGVAAQILTLDGDSTGQFDLIIGLGTADQAVKGLSAHLAANGTVILAEETPDLFAILSGRYAKDDALTRLQNGNPGLRWAAALARASETVTLLIAHPEPGAQAAAQPVPPLSHILPAAPNAESADARALRHAQAFRDVLATQDDQPVWLIGSDPDEAPALFSLRRVLVNETGRDLRVLVAPKADRADADLAPVMTSVMAAAEQEIVLDAAGIARTPRMVPRRAPQPVMTGAQDHGATLLRLAARRRTPMLDSLYWQRLPRPTPGPNDIEIAVDSAALNFRDVMWGQGLIPPEAIEGGFASQGFGMECAGRVTRVGAGVTGFTPGQPIVAFAPHALGSHVIVPAYAVMARDPDMPATVATAAPVVFLTADYALRELARLGPDETVLIHGAAGGVGLAAIQIAEQIGATIITTAGSAEKREWLRLRGVAHVFDSRENTFSDRVMAATGGRGADVVLNALAGEGLERGLGCLAPFGRFVELGKRDIYENNLIALRAMRNNISLLAVDADQLLAYRPQIARKIMDRIGSDLMDGALTPPPVRILPADNVADAFRLMQRSGHIGKIVIDMARPKQPGTDRLPQRADLSGNWLITGGTGGFGLRTAHWLKRAGADAIWLTSRSGRAPDAGDLGPDFHICQADATDPVAMRAVLADMQAQGGIAGVIHAAAVLEDARFDTLSDDAIARVARAKMGGAEVLDALTRDLPQSAPLRHFWCFSSVAARFGNPGQAPYASANADTEALIERRCRDGLAGLAIAWGPIADTGMIARDDALRSALTAQLGTLLSADQALRSLGDWLADAPADAHTITIAPIRWGRMAADIPVLRQSLFAAVDTTGTRAAGSIDLGALVAAGKEAEARRIALEAVLTEAAAILRTTASALDPQRPLTDYGLDSLMAMNLKLALEERFGIEIAARALAGDPSPGRLVQSLFDSLTGTADSAQDDAMVAAHLSDTVLTAEQRAKITAHSRNSAAG